MGAETKQLEQQIVLTDRETTHRNDSILLGVLHKPLFDKPVQNYKIISRGSSSPKNIVYINHLGKEVSVGCGTPILIARCPDYQPNTEHTKKVIKSSCNSTRCSVCNLLALQRQVALAEMPHRGLEAVLQAQGIIVPDSHTVVSPQKSLFPKDLIEEEGTKPAWDWFDNFLKRFNQGLLATSTVIHTDRKKHEDDHTGCHDPFCERDHYTEWGIHFHNFGKIYLMSTNEIKKRLKQKVTVVKLPNTFGVRNMGLSLRYELEHAKPIVKTKTDRALPFIHRMGEISKRKMSRTFIRTEYPPAKCEHPKCKQTMIEFEVDHNDPNSLEAEGHFNGFHHNPDEIWTYKFKRFPEYTALVHSQHDVRSVAYRQSASKRYVA